VSALGSEMPRQAPEVRRAATRRIKEMIDLVARQSPDWGQPGAHERALVTVATMVGTLMLARAVDDPALSARCASAAEPLGPGWRVTPYAVFFFMMIIMSNMTLSHVF
jgi:TetR/AcrR family transcriptional repressor of nem operon